MMNASFSAAAAYDDAIVVGRVPALTLTTAHALYAGGDPYEFVRELLRSEPAIRAAIVLASPTLGAALDLWLRGQTPKNKRTPLSALGYVLRMATRCTPFGMFAGVGPVALGARTTLAVAGTSERRIRARPDVGWIFDLLARYQHDPRFVWRAPVVANDLVVERGDALYVMDDGRASRVDAGGRTPVWRYDAVQLQQNAAVAWLRAAAAAPVAMDELVGRTCERFATTPEIAMRLIRKLLDARVLAFVRPSLLDEPLQALTSLLADHPDRCELDDLATAFANFERDAPGDCTPERVASFAARLQEHAAVDGAAFGVDTVDRWSGTLARSVVDEAALLARTMLADGVSVGLEPFVKKFIDRYESLDRLVPLLDLVHDDFVLEAEAAPDGVSTARAVLLAGIAAAALRDGDVAVALDDETFDRIFPGVRSERLDQTCEIGFIVCARDAAAVDAGDYRIVPTPGANSDGAGKSTGRFAMLFDEPSRANIIRAQTARCARGTVVADLDYVPIERRSGNLIARRGVYRYAIADAPTQYASDVRRISPADILIGVEAGRFVAYSRSLQRPIELEESYLLETAYFAPPHMRFLAQLARQGRRTPRPFDWGAAAQMLPFLPRLGFGRIVLAVARWIVPRAELLGDAARVRATLDAWRLRWQLPRYVYLTERDVKLLLDLDSPLALDLLRDQLPKYRGDGVLFEEMLPAFDETWLEREGACVAHEFVATFVIAEPAAAESAEPREFATSPVPVGATGPWVYVKLYACANELHALARDIVPQLVAACADLTDRWFFLRYHDPEHHLRLRFRAADARGMAVVERVTEVLEPLLRSGRLGRYTFDTYRREPERFGGNAALEPVERLFAADSARAVAALAQPVAGETTGERALRTLAPLLCAWFAVFDVDAWLRVSAQLAAPAGEFDYDLVRRISGYLDESVASAAPDERAAIAELAGIEAAGLLTRPSGYVLGAIVHMHFNRAGVEFADEPRLEAHVRRALQSQIARRAAQAKAALRVGVAAG